MEAGFSLLDDSERRREEKEDKEQEREDKLIEDKKYLKIKK